MPLPREVLRFRLKNEIESCQKQIKHHIEVSDPYLKSFPITLSLTLLRVPGPYLADGKVLSRFIHSVQVIITEDYPYEKPIVKWQTPIFHPNIMPPEDGGYVCTKLLENWDFRSTLTTFIKGIEVLLANPNPNNPFGNDLCTRAAEYFRKHRYLPGVPSELKHRPRVVGGGDVQKAEDPRIRNSTGNR
jgi:ubiquitin-protein ligase